jgi:Putative peptidoglycan binding domain
MSPYDVMNEGSEREPFSVPKLLAGGIAVALITFIGVTMWLPPRPSPAGPASATARPWDAAQAVANPAPTPRQPPSAAPPALPLSAAQPPAVAEPPAEAVPVGLTAMQPVEPRGTTALSGRLFDILRSEDPEAAPPKRQAQEPPKRQARQAQEPPWRQAQEPPRRQAQEPPRPTGAERNPPNRSDTASLQRKLQELGYYAGDDKGVWGDASRRALQDFKRMNGLQDDDKRDRETEAQLMSGPGVPASRTFIGRWALDADECVQRVEGTQLIIDTRGAESSGGKCDFRSFKQESAGSWRVQAVCSASGKSWNSDIGLKLNGPRLRWSSERGTEAYVRCLTL